MSGCVRKYIERQVYNIPTVYCPLVNHKPVSVVVCRKCARYWGVNIKDKVETINCEVKKGLK